MMQQKYYCGRYSRGSIGSRSSRASRGSRGSNGNRGSKDSRGSKGDRGKRYSGNRDSRSRDSRSSYSNRGAGSEGKGGNTRWVSYSPLYPNPATTHSRVRLKRSPTSEGITPDSLLEYRCLPAHGRNKGGARWGKGGSGGGHSR